MEKPNVGDTIKASIYGKAVPVEVLRVRPFGTLDVERLSDGKCFRVSGLGLWDEELKGGGK